MVLKKKQKQTHFQKILCKAHHIVGQNEILFLVWLLFHLQVQVNLQTTQTLNNDTYVPNIKSAMRTW